MPTARLAKPRTLPTDPDWSSDGYAKRRYYAKWAQDHRREPGVHDEWSIPFLDKRILPALISEEDQTLRRVLRRMRRKARMADELLEANRKMAAQLAVRPEPQGVGHNHIATAVTREQIATLAGLGTPLSGIARFMHVDERTLKEYYADELELGKTTANIQVSSTLYSVATDRSHPGVVKAATKWLESRGGPEWKDERHVVNKNLNPAAPPIINSRFLSPEKRAQLRALMEEMVAAQDASEQPAIEHGD